MFMNTAEYATCCNEVCIIVVVAVAAAAVGIIIIIIIIVSLVTGPFLPVCFLNQR